MSVDRTIAGLAQYGVQRGLIEECDRVYTVNRLLEALGLDSYAEAEPVEAPLEDMLGMLLDDAVARGACEGDVTSRDLLDTRLMGALTRSEEHTSELQSHA